MIPLDRLDFRSGAAENCLHQMWDLCHKLAGVSRSEQICIKHHEFAENS